jgi:hypothetical protein
MDNALVHLQACSNQYPQHRVLHSAQHGFRRYDLQVSRMREGVPQKAHTITGCLESGQYFVFASKEFHYEYPLPGLTMPLALRSISGQTTGVLHCTC